MERKRIFVGLSGGVDSAVSAALLQKAGHDVTGVFIRTWHPEGFPCSEGEDEREAMKVAAHLAIPFLVLDLGTRYETDVAKQFIDGYKNGETPNPDILCNKHVKFGGFLDFAKKMGAEKVATGHYAQLFETESGVELGRGVDIDKDQSYFLAMLTKDQLSSALFPIGGLRKEEVRALALKLNLPNAKRKDSQGICFLGEIDMKTFLSRYIEVKEGNVLSDTGHVIGTHKGAPLYTIGERHGFFVPNSKENGEPLYVQGIDIAANTVTVVPKSKLKGQTSIVLRSFNELQPIQNRELTAQVRYHGEQVSAQVAVEGDVAHVTFDKPVLQAFGQTIALYAQDRLVGAGISTAKPYTV